MAEIDGGSISKLEYDSEIDKIIDKETGRDWEPEWKPSADDERGGASPATQKWYDEYNASLVPAPGGGWMQPGAPAASATILTPEAPTAAGQGVYFKSKPNWYGGSQESFTNSLIQGNFAPDPYLYPAEFAAWNVTHANEPNYGQVMGVYNMYSPTGQKIPYYGPGSVKMEFTPSAPSYPNYPGSPTNQVPQAVQDEITYYTTKLHRPMSDAEKKMIYAKYGYVPEGTGGLIWTSIRPAPSAPLIGGGGPMFQAEPWHPLMSRISFSPIAPQITFSPAAPIRVPTSYGMNPLPRYLRRI